MDVCEGVGLGVPPPETEIKPADAGALVVDNDYLLRAASVGRRNGERGRDLLVM